jgi:hypothetical protein
VCAHSAFDGGVFVGGLRPHEPSGSVRGASSWKASAAATDAPTARGLPRGYPLGVPVMIRWPFARFATATSYGCRLSPEIV